MLYINPFCELCRKEREASGQLTDNFPLETVAHIQSAGCKAQKQCVTQAHNSCWKFLLRSIMENGTIKRQGTSTTSVWTDSVRNAFRKQAGMAKVQDMYMQAARNWSRRVCYPRNQRWMQTTRGQGRANGCKGGKV